MKLYREVKASERLPDKEQNLLTSKSVLVFYEYGDGGMSYYNYETNQWFADKNVKSWLEPFEISEEEIIKVLGWFTDGYFNFNGDKVSAINRVDFDNVAKAIKQLLT